MPIAYCLMQTFIYIFRKHAVELLICWFVHYCRTYCTIFNMVPVWYVHLVSLTIIKIVVRCIVVDMRAWIRKSIWYHRNRFLFMLVLLPSLHLCGCRDQAKCVELRIRNKYMCIMSQPTIDRIHTRTHWRNRNKERKKKRLLRYFTYSSWFCRLGCACVCSQSGSV